MRYYNLDNELKAYSVTGTQTVLITLDINKTKVIDNDKGFFMGFKINRKEGNTQPILFNGTKRFASDKPDKPKQKLSPWQTYLWKDYTADPGKTYTYIVEAMFGTWDNMNPGYTTTLNVTTEQLNEGEHSVFFNFGVTGCQAYAKQFAKKEIDTLPESDKEKAFAILGRELFTDGLLNFVAQANSSKYKLLGAFYEIDYKPFLDALKNAKIKGAEVEIVYSARPGQVKDNEEAIEKAGLQPVSIPRNYQVAQPHNKFMILLENNKPVQVWTGSTNITIRGIFGHSNTGHLIKNEAVAKQYLEYWNMLSQNPAKADFTAKTESIQKDINGAHITEGTKVIFSPRKTDAMLVEYVKLMDSAKEAVCIIYPFNIEKIFKNFYAEDRPYLRFIITDKGGDKNKIITNDRDVIKTQGAVLDTAVEHWVVEITSKTTTGASTLYVHNKFFIVDPLSASPVVVSGSANFSDESLTKNDENTLIIKGDKRVADIYFTEFSRMFDHFMPRYLQKIKEEKKSGHTLSQAGFGEPLDEKGVWCGKYYDKDSLKTKRKQMFIKMKGAKKGR
jgi:phosphatidylserine/phosphatidylglycerophosphate/cardiolipin synthase-like enzyme